MKRKGWYILLCVWHKALQVSQMSLCVWSIRECASHFMNISTWCIKNKNTFALKVKPFYKFHTSCFSVIVCVCVWYVHITYVCDSLHHKRQWYLCLTQMCDKSVLLIYGECMHHTHSRCVCITPMCNMWASHVQYVSITNRSAIRVWTHVCDLW